MGLALWVLKKRLKEYDLGNLATNEVEDPTFLKTLPCVLSPNKEYNFSINNVSVLFVGVV